MCTFHWPQCSWQLHDSPGSGLLLYLLPEGQPLTADLLGGQPHLPCIELFLYSSHVCICNLFAQMPQADSFGLLALCSCQSLVQKWVVTKQLLEFRGCIFQELQPRPLTRRTPHAVTLVLSTGPPALQGSGEMPWKETGQRSKTNKSKF